ncbi:hypothetical protein Tsubulata_008851 [Turnera subulata]|uniref:Uncharacterized protein n=1 Tax=Turnera subulata TaxID=218843 RepID=A0A9Q0F307_9ROSI|nr:hypothetical protein Tsubulata_008851 [Turnera subulata]
MDNGLMNMEEEKQKGGFRACIFIFVLQGLENMGSIANMAVLVLYFNYAMHFDLATSANTLTNFMGSVFLFSILGAFISDAYLNRFYTTLLFGALEVVGLVLVTIQARFKDLQPEMCGKSSCIKGGQALMFYGSLCLLAIGSGTARGALPPLGGDQFVQDERQRGALSTYYNWLFLSSTSGGVIGVTFVVWISMSKAWYWGFFLVTVGTFVGYITLAFGKPFFRFQPLGNSPPIKIAQVIVVAFRNRSLSLPERTDDLYEIDETVRDPSEERIPHSKQFSSLDKAAIPREDSTAPDAWKVCTVTQVEEVKVLIRMLPIVASTILLNTGMAQLQTFSVQQGMFMDPHIGSKEIPTPSLSVIPLLFMTILMPLYELFFVPFARKITGHPSGITQLQRVGVGLVLSIISMTVAGGIEVYRKDQANKIPSHKISVFWLCIQFFIFGIADMFTIVGLMELYYKEAPSGMRSLAASFSSLTFALGYFLSSIFVSTINAVTKRITPSKQGWLHGNNINTNNLHLFYWFVAAVSAINFVIYLFVASWYKYKEAGVTESETKTES